MQESETSPWLWSLTKCAVNINSCISMCNIDNNQLDVVIFGDATHALFGHILISYLYIKLASMFAALYFMYFMTVIINSKQCNDGHQELDSFVQQLGQIHSELHHTSTDQKQGTFWPDWSFSSCLDVQMCWKTRHVSKATAKQLALPPRCHKKRGAGTDSESPNNTCLDTTCASKIRQSHYD